MTRRGFWQTLGIDPTADTAAIRRAYAAALRAMDPDADPDAFARLRQARDAALASARAAAPTAGEPTDPGSPDAADAIVSPLAADVLAAPVVASEAPGTIGINVAPAGPRPLSDARADSGRGHALDLPDLAAGPPLVEGSEGDVSLLDRPAIARYDFAYSTLQRLLQGNDVLNPEGMQVLIGFLLTDPRLGQLTFAADAERWFAEVLAGTIPRSDPILARIAAHFGWARAAGSLGLAPAAERVAQRARALDYAAEAAEPAHPHHKLWTELTRPAHEKSRRDWTIGRKRMRDYLASLRRNYPEAEAWFDPMRVALWTARRTTGPGWRLWGIGAFLLIRVLVYLAADPDHSRAPSGAPTPIVVATTVGDLNRDLNLALLAFADGFTLARVRVENPALADTLEERWREAAAERESLDDFIFDTAHFLLNRFAGAVARAPYADVAALRRMDLAELTEAQSRGSDSCARLLAGTLPLDELRDRDAAQKRRRVIAAIVLADTKGTPPPPGATYTIPGAVMARLGRETGLDRAALDAALDRHGPAAARCAARRALLADALALPPATALPLLRGM